MVDFRISSLIAGAAFVLSLLLGMFSRAAMPLLILRPLLFAILFFVISALAKYLVSRFLPELLEERSAGDTADMLSGSRINITETGSQDDILAFSRDTSSMDASMVSPGIKVAIPKPLGVGMKDSEDSIGNVSELLRNRPASRPPSADEELVPEETAEEGQAGMDQNTQIGYTEPEVMEEIPSWGLDGEAKSLPGEPSAKSSRESAAERVTPEPAFRPEPVLQTEPAFQPESQFQPDPEPPRVSTDILPDLDSMAGAFRSASTDSEPDGLERSSMEYSVPASSNRPSNRPQPQLKGDFNAKDMARGLQTVLSKEKEG